MGIYELVTPTTKNEWASYHFIRRQVLWEARGLFGVYDENHPDEVAPNNYPKLLTYGDEPVGVVRIDIDGRVATLRRVAVLPEAQRRGHGRVLLDQAQGFALNAGCTRLLSFVAPDAVGFYQGCGFHVVEAATIGPSGRASVLMAKELIGQRAGC